MRLTKFLILNKHLYLSGIWLGANLGMDFIIRVLERDWTTCSNFVNHSEHHGQHNSGGGGPFMIIHRLEESSL